MYDELNAIRRLYGEPGTEGPPPDAQAELDALAEVKAALDRLPRQRPDPSLIDAVVAAAGEAAQAAALGPIRTVYGEEPEPLVSARAEAEVAALAPVKAALDRLPPQRPDLPVIEAVVAAAAQPAPAAAPAERAADRPARRENRRRVVAALSAVFAVVLVFGGGLWLTQGSDAPQQVAERVEAEQQGPDEQLAEEQVADATPPVTEAPAEASAEEPNPADPAEEESPLVAMAPQRPAASVPSGGETGSPRVVSALRAEATAPAAPLRALSAMARADAVTLGDAEELPLGDGDEELRLLYLRLREMQAAQAGLGWDTPPVSLGAAPDSAPAAAGWMQVRVQH